MKQTRYDVFISYSRKDYVDEYENVIPNSEVFEIMKALTDAGITYWIDKEGIYSGDKFTEELPKIIKSASIFVYLSTANSNKSKYTSKEIAIADEYGKYIIPVRIDMTPYSDKVIFRIADISYVNYSVNPIKGREDLVKSIKAFIKKEKENEYQKQEERLRKEDFNSQRILQEEEKKRQEKIAKIESEITSLEVQKVECEKVVLKREQELKLAQVDLKACELKIQKLQDMLKKQNKSVLIMDYISNPKLIEGMEDIPIVGSEIHKGNNQKGSKTDAIKCVQKGDYYYGKQEYIEALEWYRRAADLGNATAQFNLGYMYQSAIGVPLDKDLAEIWYRKAANQGDYDAIKALKGLTKN